MGRARAATETEARLWHERHPTAWAAIKSSIGAAVGLAIGALVWFTIDLRDDVRDNTAATSEHVEIRAKVKSVEAAAVDESAALRVRVRAVETVATRQTVALEWIVRSLERLERAAGTAPHAPPAPVLGPPEPAPEPLP